MRVRGRAPTHRHTVKDADGKRVNLRREAVMYLYSRGYRITTDGRLARPFHGVESIPKITNNKTGPITMVLLTCSDGEVREVPITYALLAVASFYGPEALRKKGRFVYANGDVNDLRKANFTWDTKRADGAHKWGDAPPKVSARERAWERKRREAAEADLRRRIGDEKPSPLLDTKLCLTVFAAVEGKIATIAQVAQRLNVTPDMVFSMLTVARSHKERQQREKEKERARQLRSQSLQAAV